MPPNILVIMTDQQRHDCLGAAGHLLLKTPNMDRLAQRGVRFTHAHTNAPLCMPARISLLCGRYPQNTHIWDNCGELPAEIETYVKALSRGGYRTCHVGKAHLYYHENTDLKKQEPYMRSLGWEDLFETQGTWSSVRAHSIYYDYLKKHGLNEVFDRYYIDLDAKPDSVRRYTAEPCPLPEEHVLDSFIGRTAVNYIRNYDDTRPSFMFVGFQGPHEPWDPPVRFATMYDPDDCPDPVPELKPGPWLSSRALQYNHGAQYIQPDDPRKYKQIAACYFGKISLIDKWVGKIVDAYDQRGWLEDTVVIVASDHGEMLGDLQRVSKSMFYEQMVRVPLLISGPGINVTVSDAFVELIDLFVTMLDLAGCSARIRPDGVSVVPILHGQRTAVRQDILAQVHGQVMLRQRRWKLVVDADGQTLQLFDLAIDPQEQQNLAGHRGYTAIEQDMRDSLLRRLLASLQRPFVDQVEKVRPTFDQLFEKAQAFEASSEQHEHHRQ